MKILLLTRNHVVREFIELVADRVGATLEVRDRADTTPVSDIDYLFVDDRGGLLEESLPLLAILKQAQHIVLYNEPKEAHEAFDLTLKKPFLPSDIEEILHAQTPAQESIAEDQVLNIQDIEEIKALLEEEGMEIIAEENLADEIDTPSPILSQEETHSPTMEEKLLEAISRMEPKKIRKLLRGAQVQITIRFPKEES